MTRNEVSIIQTRWYDSQRVDQTDMVVEQDYNINTNAAIIQNHFGSGVIPESFKQTVIFDTHSLWPGEIPLIASNDLDGTGLTPITQTSDSVLGNQLEVELTDSDSDLNGSSSVGGRFSSKVLIIGLDFQGNLQYDRFYFYRKEKQVTKKHYVRVLSIFLNDVYGNRNCSRKLGGRVIIRETKSMQLSREPVMISQDVEPNLFFRDFKISNVIIGSEGIEELDALNDTVALYNSIQAGIGSEYDVDALNININVKRDVELPANDITTRLAQKFLATNNNIQKITLLLGARKDSTAITEEIYNWSGELIVNIFELQSTVSCPTDLVPQLAIEFDPNPEPIVQFSIDINTLKDYGYILTDVLQPVDFVFSNTIIGSTSNTKIIPGKYYAISINRSGDASVGTLFTGVGNSSSTNDRFSVFSSYWVDVPDEDMWYQVWTDSAKVSDGKAYDNGHGIDILKTTKNELGAVIDYSFGNYSFTNNGQNTLNTAVIEAILQESDQEQDERTGNTVYSRQKFEASLSFVTNTELATLRESSDPLVIGCARDINARNNSIIRGTQYLPGLAKGNSFIIVNPDVNLLSQQLIGSKLVPYEGCGSNGYKIIRTKICTDGYGDVNGDGVIDDTDIAKAIEIQNYLSDGYGLFDDYTQELIRDGYIDTLEFLRADVNGDGYVDATDVNAISNYVNKIINSFDAGTSFRHIEIEVQNLTGRFDGYYDCNGLVAFDGYSYSISPSELSAVELQYYGYNSLPDITADNTVIFEQVPWTPVNFVINPIPFWQDYLLQFNSGARQVPAVFTYSSNVTSYIDFVSGSCSSTTESEVSLCQEVESIGGACSSGRNDLFIPNNLIIGDGQILNTNGDFFKQDLEIHTITLEIPVGVDFDGYSINVFDKLVAESDGYEGFTRAMYPAVKFSDCSYVQYDALIKNQIRFGVAIQSLYLNIDGEDGYGYGVIVHDAVGVNIDQATGILRLSIKDISYDVLNPQLRTKILITLYLKKAGWNNTPLVVDQGAVAGLLS